VDRAVYFTAGGIVALKDDHVMALSRNAALVALQGGSGLIETDCPLWSGKAYRAFLVGREDAHPTLLDFP